MNSIVSCSLIAGEASDRKFYRALLDNGETMIKMVFPDWEKSFGGGANDWIEMHCVLSERDIPLPAIFKIEKEESTIWLEDLGDNFLNIQFPHTNTNIDFKIQACSRVLQDYKTALDLLISAQYPKEDYPGPNPAKKRVFDFEKLFYEMEFFLEHFVKNFLKLSNDYLSKIRIELDAIRFEFSSLCQILATRPTVLCHRDYHSRNILNHNSKIYWIDFQDARMGPHTYDVVSLLRDSYVKMSWPTRQLLFEYYFEKMNNRRIEIGMSIEHKLEYMEEAMLMGLQRNIKALGSFGYLIETKNKDQYLKYIEPTLQTLVAQEALEFHTFTPLNRRFPNIICFLQALLHGTLSPFVRVAIEQRGKK